MAQRVISKSIAVSTHYVARSHPIGWLLRDAGLCEDLAVFDDGLDLIGGPNCPEHLVPLELARRRAPPLGVPGVRPREGVLGGSYHRPRAARQDGELRGPRGSTLPAEAGCSTRSTTIGTNKRYADHYDRLAAERIAQVVARAAMTLDVYADLFEDDLDAVTERLDEARAQATVGVSWGKPA